MIRKAILEDMEALIKLGRKAHQTSPTYRDVPMDETKCRMLVINSLADKDSVILVAERNGRVTGFLIGIAEELFFSRKKYATDLMVYSDRSGEAAQLIRRFHFWAKQRGCVEVIMGTSFGGSLERTEPLYDALGMKRIGSMYAKEALQ